MSYCDWSLRNQSIYVDTNSSYLMDVEVKMRRKINSAHRRTHKQTSEAGATRKRDDSRIKIVDEGGERGAWPSYGS